MDKAMVIKIRNEVEQFKIKVPVMDEATKAPKRDASDQIIYEDRRPPLYVRLDNEHIIEEGISELFWDDANERLIWFESPTRGNSFVAAHTMLGSTLQTQHPVMVSFAEYGEIQQMSFFPNKEQFEGFLDTVLVGGGLAQSQYRDLYVKTWFDRTNQEWLIKHKDLPPEKQEGTKVYDGVYVWPEGTKPKH